MQMEKKKLSRVLVVAALAAVMQVPGTALGDDLQVQLNAQQKSMLDLQNQVQSLTYELNAAKGQIEELKYDLHRLRQEIADSKSGAYAAAPAQSTAVAPAAEPVAQPAPLQPAPPPAASDPGQQAYQKAYDKVLANDLPGAGVDFQNFIAQYPEHPLIPNAWYWLGQVQYKQFQLQEARVSFLNAASFKNSGKRPDALYKLGLIVKSLGDKEKARRYFQLVIDTYPADTSAVMARQQLAQL